MKNRFISPFLNRPGRLSRLSLLAASVVTVLGCNSAITSTASISKMDWATAEIPSLAALSIGALRQRQYGSEFQLLTGVDNQRSGYQSYMTRYNSDGLNVYARIDIPDAPAPNAGYPVLLYSHGWVGETNAPSFNFFLDQTGSQARYIDQLAQSGFIVITPGWRGHGTVNNVAADGIEFMKRWDNASYISPIFYAIDMLNALDSVSSIETLLAKDIAVPVNLSKVFLAGHSQGGDSALITLAIAGEGSQVTTPIAGASIFAGCFLPRIKQGELYGTMASTPQAFMAGDGQWNGTPIGANGEINADFQFPFPPDWIGTTDTAAWTWQHQSWSMATVREAYRTKYGEMYRVLKREGIGEFGFTLSTDHTGKTVIEHPEEIIDAYRATSAFHYPQYLQEPLVLHYSDQDYYSPPKWNKALADSVNGKGGDAKLLEYSGNTHSLQVSKYPWFSPPGTVAGLDQMLEHDIATFKSAH
ncbi:alpha/beta hydrolase family protein [Thalassotalea litorea]|nr:alpha/beta fold hydrolase [Thalassotalea litorea]